MARSLPAENLLPQNVGSIINYLQYTEPAQWGTPICSQPQRARDNGVRDGRSNWLVAPPPRSWAVPPERLVHSINQCTQLDSNVQPQHVRQPPCLCGHSWHNISIIHPYFSYLSYGGIIVKKSNILGDQCPHLLLESHGSCSCVYITSFLIFNRSCC